MNYLRNKNININTKINFIENLKYFEVNTYCEVKQLRHLVEEKLNKDKGPVQNKATGFNAIITRETIQKIIHQTSKSKFNSLTIRYIDNLNAAYYLKELFENAVYIDTLNPMKGKVNNVNELGYHHFVAPLKRQGECYKAFITVREKVNSKILYVVSVKLFKFNYLLNSISAKDLIDNTSIWNYDLNDYNYYIYSDFVAESFDYRFDYNYIWLIN